MRKIDHDLKLYEEIRAIHFSSIIFVHSSFFFLHHFISSIIVYFKDICSVVTILPILGSFLQKQAEVLLNADDLDAMWVCLRENCSIDSSNGVEKVSRSIGVDM